MSGWLQKKFSFRSTSNRINGPLELISAIPWVGEKWHWGIDFVPFQIFRSVHNTAIDVKFDRLNVPRAIIEQATRVVDAEGDSPYSWDGWNCL